MMDLIYSSKKRNTYFIISGLLAIISIAVLFIIPPKIGIDFTGGVLMELKFNKTISKDEVLSTIKTQDFITDAKVQNTSNESVLIRTNVLEKKQIEKMHSIINEQIGEYEEIRLDTVGPTISNNTISKSIIAILIASFCIITYIAYAFRKIPKPASSWRFGICAIIALIHDLLISAGIYTILSYYFNFEINSLFIVAILTILGYSVNDTIIVFDRIRENIKLNQENDFSQIANTSVVQTITRSINTSVTLLLVLLSLLFLGGESIQSFIALLLMGTIIGTYSSIFIAPTILIAWQNKLNKQN